jgi:polysaccharide biosynthesis transport protein
MPPVHEPAPGLRAIVLMLRRNAVLIAGVTAVFALLAVLLTRTLPATYESAATVRFAGEQKGGGLLGQVGAIPGLGSLGGLGGDEIETDIDVLKSRRIVDVVVDSADLHVVLVSPRVPRTQLLRVLHAGPDARPGVWEFTRAGGRYELRRLEGTGPAPAPVRVAPSAPARLGNVTVALVRGATAERVKVEVQAAREAAERVIEELAVERSGMSSRLVTLRYAETDPQLAAGVVNGVARAFIRYKSQSTTSDSRASAAMLEEQVLDYQAQLADSEERMKQFREQQRVVEPKTQAEEQIRRVAEMQAKHDALLVERSALSQVLADAGRAGAGEGASAYRRLATFPTFIANRAIQDVLETLTKLETERAELVERRTDADPTVVALDARIEALEQQLLQFGSSYLNSLDRQLASTGGMLRGYGTEMAAIPAQDLEFARLAREQKMLTEVYAYLQTRLQEARIQAATVPQPAQIVDEGLVPEKPFSPRPLVNVVLGVLLGMVVGTGLALGRELADTRIRGDADLNSAAEGLPILASVPHVDGLGSGVRGGRALRTVIPVLTNGAAGPRFVDLRRDGRHSTGEAFRSLRTRLIAAGADGPPRTIVVTSAMPGDGKSTVSANLAMAFARQGLRVVLVDADLRGGVLHRRFELPAEPGLAQVLTGEAVWREAARTVEAGVGKPVDVIPSGRITTDSTEILGSPAAAALVQALRAEYDVVVFDTPPLGEAADAAVLGSLGDVTLLVARTGATEREALQGAVAQLREMNVRIGGMVLNGSAEPSFSGRYARKDA